MWGSTTRRKERKERKEWRKGSRIFLFSKKVFLGKSGIGSTHEIGEDQILWGKRKNTKRRGGEIEKKGVFQRGLSEHTEERWRKRFILERGIGKKKRTLLL